ncbi:putative ribonuclease H-like domain-containing protein [Tanacetum coccineum]|uniref:Ribonuclease H-like domain-containing protein n=1 Tax=Tanacetum coccineum TaxID=301880 RepID=A0ABQ4Z133_9ASTR
MALPNEHKLKFNSYKDAKTLMQAIENRFGEVLEKFVTIMDYTYYYVEEQPEFETLSLDDLFNNLKAYESEVKGTSSSTTNSHNVAFLSSSSTNSATRAVNTAQGVNTASTQEEMDLRWNIAMLTMRARRFLNNTRRKLDMDNKERIGFDKSKVECFNCHKRGHFARECRAPMNQDSRNREPTKRTMPVEETTLNALVSQCDGFGYDWSDQSEESLTNFALMAYSSTSKFDGKADEGFFVGYSTNSKAFGVFNSRTRIVKENLHVQFSENITNITGSGPNWLFNIYALTKSMNYKPVVAGNQSNGSAGTNKLVMSVVQRDSPVDGFKHQGKRKYKDAVYGCDDDQICLNLDELAALVMMRMINLGA